MMFVPSQTDEHATAAAAGKTAIRQLGATNFKNANIANAKLDMLRSELCFEVQMNSLLIKAVGRKSLSDRSGKCNKLNSKEKFL